MAVKKQRVTIRDIAREANVSINTVSLAIKGSDLVHPDTKAIVMRVVRDLGYVPNLAAKNLRQGVVRTIGLMIPDIHNPHFWDIADGVESEARRQGYGVVLTNSNLNPESELDSIHGLLERRYDGLILATHFMQDEQFLQFKDHLQLDRPVVTFTKSWTSVDRVLYYREAAGYLLLEHLYELGHRRIGFVFGVAREGLADERLRAYRSFVGERDLRYMVEKCGPAVPDSIAAAGRLLDLPSPPSAIVAVNDYLALGVLHAAGKRGLSVPDDLSVAGFDNTSLAQYLSPSLTSVDIGGSKIGRMAAQLLFKRFAQPDRPIQVIEIPPCLIVRESTTRARD